MSAGETVDELGVLRRAFRELKELRARLDQHERRLHEPIAVVGLGCRFPGGATGPDAYWELLRDGRSGAVEVPRDRWDADAYYDPDPDAPGKTITRHGGFLHQVDGFDPAFFRISPREAVRMDPQQRLLLEVAWEALEHAGQAPDQLSGSRTGVFVGITTNDYYQLQMECGVAEFDAYSATGNALNFAAGRISYVFGFQGPCLAIDTACSSSLAAVHLACQSLRAGESDLALAGGVNLILAPHATLFMSRTRALSPDGLCKSFDAAADGMGRGEGCGMVVLKRLSDAVAAGDRVLALIRGSAVSQDGPSGGLTVPNGLAQQALIRETLSRAGIEPGEVGYIEAHGTGTPLGDPIEARALGAVLGAAREGGEPLLIGSVKANIGHLESAAGVAGLIKVVLALQHGEIPPNLHFHNPSPHIDWRRLSLAVPVQRTPWPDHPGRRVAGVSSFGLSGIIAHALVEEAPLTEASRRDESRPVHLLPLSARNVDALRELSERYARQLRAQPDLSLADLCYTAGTGRAHFNHRLAVTATSSADILELLTAYAAGERRTGLSAGDVEATGVPRIAFLFTGQGSQYVGMGQRLFESQPVFRRELERCHELLQPHLDAPLLSLLYPDRFPDLGETEAAARLEQTHYAQPALFAVEWSLAAMWRSWGIEPAALLGHSLGEYVAAAVSEVFSLEEGLKLVAARGALMQQSPPGAMAAVFAPEAVVAAEIAQTVGALAIAAVNGPQQTVVTGEPAGVDALVARLKAAGIRAKSLAVRQAFHSPLLDEALRQFREVAAQVQYAEPTLTVVSNLTGDAARGEELRSAEYWVRHAREPVRFAAGVERLRELGIGALVEVGPQPVLVGLARASWGDGEAVWAPSLRRGREDWEQAAESVAALYVAGAPIDWKGYAQGSDGRKISLPTYPFQRKRYWIDAPAAASPTALSPPKAERVTLRLYEVEWRRQDRPAGESAPGSWLIFSDRGGLGRSLAERLGEQGQQCRIVLPDLATEEEELLDSPEAYVRALNAFASQTDPGPKQVLHLCSLDESRYFESGGYDAHPPCAGALYLLQALARTEGADSPRAWFVTRGAQPAGAGSHSVDASQAPLWGMGRTAALEHPGIWGGLIDLPADPGPGDLDALLSELQQPVPGEQVALRTGGRYVARLVPADPGWARESPMDLTADAAYLVTGGLGGLGLKVARWLVEWGARYVALVGRRAPSPAAQEVLSELERTGARICVIQADVSREEEVARLLAEVGATMPPLRGIVHAAGVLEDAALLRQSPASFARVMAPKVDGAWNLHRLTREAPLDFFLTFSSAASLLGSPGQANYAAANAFLDALAHHRRELGLPAVSLNWGPWAEVGMTAEREDRRRLDLGIRPIPPADARRVLTWALRSTATQAAVLDVDWDRFSRQLPGVAPPLFADLVGESASDSQQSRPAALDPAELERLRSASRQEREQWIEAYLRERVARSLQATPSDIPAHRSLLDLGFDSLMAMELLNELKRDLRLALYPKEFYERPTLKALTGYVSAELVGGAAGRELPASDAPQSWAWVEPAAPTPVGPRLPGIVFLLSAPRSGSTLLRVMLAGHPALFSPPELHMLPFADMRQRAEKLAGSYLDEGFQRALMALQGLDAVGSRAVVEELVERAAPVQEAYRMLQDLAGERQLVDKSPAYGGSVATLQRAEAMFDGARYLHLVRHPVAVMESLVRNRMDRVVDTPAADPFLLAEQLWATWNRNIAGFLAEIEPERHCLVRYEELVTRPEEELWRICDFLGVPFDPALLEPYAGERMTDGVHRQSLSIGDPGFLERQGIDARLASAWESARLPRPLAATTRDVAEGLGYTISSAPAEPETPTAIPMRERRLDVRGLSLCLCEWGPPSGPLVLCVHGILEHGAAWEKVAQRLVRSGYRVVAPDLRGHGRSGHVGSGGSYHFIDFVADLDAVAREVGEGPFTLVGHSLGAGIAAAYAAARPETVSSLMLVECLPPVGSQRKDAATQLATHLDYLARPPHHPVFEDVETAAERLLKGTPGMSRELALRTAERITEACPGGVRWRWDPLLRTRAGIAFQGMGDLGPNDDGSFFQRLAGQGGSVTLIFGDRSDMAGRASLEQAVPASSVIRLPGGHNLHVDAPEALADAIAGVSRPALLQ